MWFGRRRKVEPDRHEPLVANHPTVEVISWNHSIGDARESLTPPVDFYTTGWNSAIARTPRVPALSERINSPGLGG